MKTIPRNPQDPRPALRVRGSSRFFISLLILVTLPLHSVAEISVVDGRGKRITLPAPPRRIVSLSPGTTEMLFALGLKSRIVANTTYCDFPAEAKSLPKIGDVTISAEKVIAQRPDLVVASGSANRTAIQTLERLGQTVFAVDPATFDQTYRAITLLGAVTGRPVQAMSVVDSMKRDVARARAAIPKGPKPAALWVVQMDPLIVVGSNSFMDDLITMAGAKNLGAAAGPGWPSMSPERVLVLRPEIILSGAETAQRVRKRSGWGSVPAVSNRRVISLGTATAVRPGPRLVEALRLLIAAIHPPNRAAP